MPTYSTEFKESIMKKIISSKDLSMLELSRESGLSKSTLYKWRQEIINKRIIKDPTMSTSTKSNKIWSIEEKLDALIETSLMTEEDLGVYCRNKGIYSTQLTEWRSDIISACKSDSKNKRAETYKLKAELKEVKKSLSYKEKALAETAALLVLKKKANSIWGESEEDI